MCAISTQPQRRIQRARARVRVRVGDILEADIDYPPLLARSSVDPPVFAQSFACVMRAGNPRIAFKLDLLADGLGF
jgi:hypothetical protein